MKPTIKQNITIPEHLTHVLICLEKLAKITRLVHWNIKGSSFLTIHEMTERHYQQYAQITDDIAERIRTYDHIIKHNFSDHKLDADLVTHQPKEALIHLSKTTNEAIYCAKTAIEQMKNDPVSEGLLVDTLGALQKNQWMIESSKE